LADGTITLMAGAGNRATLRGKWTLIYLGPGDCAVPCRQALEEMRQARRALGRDMDRVQRLYVVTVGTADTAFLTQQHPGIGLIAERQTVLALDSAIGERWSGDIFLADPLGNLVMRYPAGTAVKDIHDDLKRLLTVSSIG
jgi:cytochrome oxidase Cu insertion factor (SCO1/SenC/PrrC family)